MSSNAKMLITKISNIFIPPLSQPHHPMIQGPSVPAFIVVSICLQVSGCVILSIHQVRYYLLIFFHLGEAALFLFPCLYPYIPNIVVSYFFFVKPIFSVN